MNNEGIAGAWGKDKIDGNALMCCGGAAMAEEIADELAKLIREAAKQPGISELMAIYGQYDEYLKQSSEYLASTRAKDIITTSNSTT